MNTALAEETSAKLLLHFHVPGFCEGCQNYSVKMFDDGRVVYHGVFNVHTEGDVTYQISKSAVNDIIHIIRRSEPFQSLAQEDVSDALGKPGIQWALQAVIDGKVIAKKSDPTRIFPPYEYNYGPLMIQMEEKLGTRRFRCRVISDKSEVTKQMCNQSSCVVVIENSHPSSDLCGIEIF